MFDSNDAATRRSVLKTAGGVLGAATLAGQATADESTNDLSRGQCVYAYADDGYAAVYAECGGWSAVGRVPNHEFGTVEQVCERYDGTDWGYVVWDDASPDGWVPETDLRACVVPY